MIDFTIFFFIILLFIMVILATCAGCLYCHLEKNDTKKKQENEISLI